METVITTYVDGFKYRVHNKEGKDVSSGYAIKGFKFDETFIVIFNRGNFSFAHSCKTELSKKIECPILLVEKVTPIINNSAIIVLNEPFVTLNSYSVYLYAHPHMMIQFNKKIFVDIMFYRIFLVSCPCCLKKYTIIRDTQHMITKEGFYLL